MSTIIKGDLWSCIKRNKEKLISFNTQTWLPQQIEDYPGVLVSYLDKDFLSDSINPWSLYETPANVATFVVAPTGAGKTSMIYHLLIPQAVKVNKKVLYLCSRSALCAQQKKVAMENEFNGALKVNGIQVKDMNEYFTEQGLVEQLNFGAIDIMTYQAFIHNKSLRGNDYAFVVMDESHFVISDATFNPFTEEILEKIITSYAYTRRIYLTATPQECLDEIYSYEQAIIPSLLHCSSYMNVYFMAEDYSYLHPSFFTHENEIINLIISRPDEYWLIFVREKSYGNELKDKLSLDIPEIITADTKDSKIYTELLSSEKMPAKIIISTKVLDVGINIKTSNLNLVLFEGPDLVTLKQELGRKRIKEDGFLKVYFHTPDIETLKKRTAKIEDSIVRAKTLIVKSKNGSFIDSLEPPLYYDGSKIKFNEFHIKKLNFDLWTYKEIIAHMESVDDPEKQGLLYAKWILSHFEGLTYDRNKLF